MALVHSPAVYYHGIGLMLCFPMTSKLKGDPFEVGVCSRVLECCSCRLGQKPGLECSTNLQSRERAGRGRCRGIAKGQLLEGKVKAGALLCFLFDHFIIPLRFKWGRSKSPECEEITGKRCLTPSSFYTGYLKFYDSKSRP